MSRPPQPPGEPPVSFRTIPGRNRTQKWNQAKTYNYDGDDWGGYDPYDEYGGPSDSRSPPPPASAHPAYAQNSRSNRANSFEPGEERRAFSHGHPVAYEEDRNGSMTSRSRRPSDNYGGRPRDFTNPEQVPRPLNTRVSPSRTSPAPPSSAIFPPRKSTSRGPSPSASAVAQEAPQQPGAMDKPLPFIRPSDIYKRMNEEKERERQSLDSSRPSMDAIQRDHSSSPGLGPRTSNDSDNAPALRMKPSLEPVAEKRESILSLEPTQHAPAQFHDANYFHQSEQSELSLRPILPSVSDASGFGNSGGLSGDIPSVPGAATQPAEVTASRVLNAPVEAESGLTHSQQGMSDATAAPTGQNHAADILAEREHSVPVSAIGQQTSGDLQHQPSSGFKSVVNKAFDRQDDDSIPQTPISRDNSQTAQSSGVGRSDTNSTVGISPIMSHMPSSASQRNNEQVPTVLEEPAQQSARPESTTLLPSSTYQIPRKASPGVSSNSSWDAPANVEPGYRRSLDPPSNGTSPARTPAVDDVSGRRLSTPMAAETLDASEAPDVIDQGSEIPGAHLEPTTSTADEVDEYSKALPNASGRSRSGTNYSLRESDLARAVNASPEDGTYQPAAAEAENASREQFLREHGSTPATPSSAFGPMSPAAATAAGLGLVRTTTPNSAKGRVREIADKYHEIHEAARRGSETSALSNKSSWSNFRGSEENLHDPVGTRQLRRTNTGSQLGISASPDHEDERVESPDGMFPQYDNSGDKNAVNVNEPEQGGAATSLDPEAAKAQNRLSFRPSMPGQWISAAPTPAGEEPPTLSSEGQDLGSSVGPRTPRSSQLQESESGEDLDLTPTTKKKTLQGQDNFDTASAASSFGPPSSSSVPDFTPTSSSLGHNNDHSKRALAAGTALGATLMANEGLTSQSRDFASREAAPVHQPELDPHPSIGNIYGYNKPHFPPPLERGESFATEGTASTASMSPQKEIDEPSYGKGEENRRPGENHYADNSVPEPVAPLKFRSGPRLDGTSETSPERPTMMQSAFSADSINTGDAESDRLRREIVQSLGPETSAAATHDASNAPMLNKKFSWERTDDDVSSGPAPTAAPLPPPQISEPEPEVSPEMPYERPQSMGLHVANPGQNEVPVSPVVDTLGSKDKALPPIVSPISRSASPLADNKDSLAPEGSQQTNDLTEIAPSPISRQASDATSYDHRLPSYYFSGSDVLGLGAAGAAGAAVTAAAVGSHSRNESGNTDAAVNQPKDDDLPPIPSAVEKDASSPTSAKPRPTSGSPRIPPFREILAVKDANQRIDAYTTTRQTFATMDTGLDGWLQTMMNRHPEHASLAEVPPGGYKSQGPFSPISSTQSFRTGHRKASPSLARLGLGGVGGNAGDRKVSGAGDGDAEASSPSGVVSAELQQRGKDLMKNAGVLGGKAQAGAKGLFAKGKSRFGRKDGGDAKASTTSLALTPPSPQQPTRVPPAPRPPSISFQSDTVLHTQQLLRPTGQFSRGHSSQSTATLSTFTPSAGTSSINLPNTAGGASKPSRMNRLSSTFSRLHARSRSVSTTRSSNRSRPTSMLLTAFEPNVEPPAGNHVNHDAFAADAPPLEERMIGNATRKEAWQASPRVPRTPPETYENGDISRIRLGVLPSPGQDSESLADIMDFSNLGEKNVHGDEVEDNRLDTGDHVNTDQTVMEDIQNPKATSNTLGEGSANDATTKAGPELPASNDAPSSPKRPTQERRASARESLPSQRRASKQGPPTPTDTPGFWRRSLVSVDGSDAFTTAGVIPTVVDEPPVPALPTAPVPISANEASTRLDDVGCVSSMQVGGIDPKMATPFDSRINAQDAPLADMHHLHAPTSGKKYDSDVSEESIIPPTHPTTTQTDRMSEFEKDTQIARNPSLNSRHSSVSSLGDETDDFEKRRSIIDDPKFQQIRTPAAEGFLQVRPAALAPAVTATSPATHAPRADINPQATREAKNKYTHEPSSLFGSDNKTGDGAFLGIPKSRYSTSPSSDFMARSDKSNDGPFLGVPRSTLPSGEFMARPYNATDTERPLSYLPLPRDSAGNPMNETIDTVRLGGSDEDAFLKETGAYVDFPSVARPVQEHPAFRNSPPIGPQDGFHHDQSARAEDTSRFAAPMLPSEMRDTVRGPEKPIERLAETTHVNVPIPQHTPNPQETRVEFQQRDTEPAARPQPQIRPDHDPSSTKRKSGIWDSFKRNSTIFKDEMDEENVPPTDSRRASVPTSKSRETGEPATLKKRHTQPMPQRAVSSMTPPAEGKKRRFSGLASLFGRSNTSGRESPKPSKLAKAPQKGKDAAVRQSAGQIKYNTVGHTGAISGYENYEAMRRRQIPDLSTHQSAVSQEARNSEAEAFRPIPPPKTPPFIKAALQAKDEARKSLEQRRSQDVQRATQVKSLPTMPGAQSGDGEEEQLFVPVAFRPTEASFGERVKAVGPLPNGTTGNFHQSSHGLQRPVRQSSLPVQPYGPVPAQSRNYHDNTSPYPSAQSNYTDVRARPNQTAGYDGQTVAQTTHRRHSEQQSPWAISLPQEGTPIAPQRRTHSWAVQNEPPRPSVAPTQPPHQERQQRTTDMQWPPNTQYPTMRPGGRHSLPPPSHRPSQDDPQLRHRRIPWSSDPPMPTPQQQQELLQASQVQNAAQTRYYQAPPIHQQPTLPAIPARSSFRPVHVVQPEHAPMSRGYGEEESSEGEAVMRASSYPGQEWVPPGGGWN